MGSLKDAAFGDQPCGYPASPGFKRPGTSQAAAQAVGRDPKLPKRKLALLNAIKSSPAGLTADEAADLVGESVLYARPRITELFAAKLLVDTGQVRENKSGLKATVWKAAGQ